MIIKNLDKAESYQLSPSTQLEVERTNPFFNDYGEQTVPLSLPASPHNCQLLDHPERPGRKAKATAINALIQDGAYCAECRQYVLSAQDRGTIETSFYLNDGSFYSRLQDTRLKDLFNDESDTISFTSVDAAIDYMRTLRTNEDPLLAAFPILVTDDSGSDQGYNYKVINGWGREDIGWIPFHFDATSADCDFYNAKPRKETIDGKTIDIAAGYYMSPFVRANYVLRRVISHYGYTLDDDNLLFTAKPFDKMVLLNSCIDTIVNSKIRLADLVPDVAVSDFINLYRKKFCCEFVPDEGKRTMRMVFSTKEAEASMDFNTGENEKSAKNHEEEKRVYTSTQSDRMMDFDEIGSKIFFYIYNNVSKYDIINLIKHFTFPLREKTFFLGTEIFFPRQEAIFLPYGEGKVDR